MQFKTKQNKATNQNLKLQKNNLNINDSTGFR